MHIVYILTKSCRLDVGMDVRVLKEVKYLHQNGADVTILCWDRTPEVGLLQNEYFEGINIVRFKHRAMAGTGIKQLPAYLCFIRSCKNYIKNIELDYLHCMDLDGTIVGYIVKKKKPYVFDMREYYDKPSQGIKNILRMKIVSLLIRKSYASLYVTDACLEGKFRKYKKKLYSLKNYPDKESIYPLPKTKSNVFRVCYHGAIRGQDKEFLALFEAVKDLDGVEVNINGGIREESIIAKTAKKYKNCHLHGKYNGIKDSAKLYSDTDVLFCAYNPKNENYQGHTETIKFHEAIATGTPMIATKDLGMGKKVERNLWGIAVDTRNPEEIRSAILQLKKNKDLWTSCHENLLNASKTYDWDNEVVVLKKIYKLN